MAKALEMSLDVLGEPSKKALLLHPMHTSKIPIDRKDWSMRSRARSSRS